MDGGKRCKKASVDEKLFIRFQETENGGFRKRISVGTWTGPCTAFSQALTVNSVIRDNPIVPQDTQDYELPCPHAMTYKFVLTGSADR